MNFSNFNYIRLFCSVQVRAQKVFLSSCSSLVSVSSDDDDNSRVFLLVIGSGFLLFGFFGLFGFFLLISKLAENCQVHKQNLLLSNKAAV